VNKVAEIKVESMSSRHLQKYECHTEISHTNRIPQPTKKQRDLRRNRGYSSENFKSWERLGLNL